MTPNFSFEYHNSKKYAVIDNYSIAGDKYIVVGNRDLYIYNVSAGDSYNGFICRTINRLTDEIQTSAYPARITVTGKVQRINYSRLRNNIRPKGMSIS